MAKAGPKGHLLPAPWGDLTLKALAERAAADSPSRIFLCDCPARETWNGMEPRRLTFDGFLKSAQFLAAQLKTLGVQPGEYVLIVLPNMVEVGLSVLACQMAGAIPALVGADERVDVLRSAAERINAALLITTARVGDIRLGEKCRQVAAKVMSIRCIAGFGFDLPEGIVGLEGWSEEDVMDLPERTRRQDEPALVTFGREKGQLCAFVRNEAQVIAEALALDSLMPLDDNGALISLMHPGAAVSVAAGLVLPLHAKVKTALIGPFSGATLDQVMSETGPAWLFAPDHFAALLPPEALGATEKARLLGIVGLSRVDAPTSTVLPAGKLGAKLVLDFNERGMMIASNWPADGKLGLPTIYPHPVQGLLPEGMAHFACEASADQALACSGFAAAGIIRRGEDVSKAAQNPAA